MVQHIASKAALPQTEGMRGRFVAPETDADLEAYKQKPAVIIMEEANPSCMREWCDARKASWEQKCTWGGTCNGCSDCATICPKWCTDHARNLEVMFTWPGCEPCRGKLSPNVSATRVPDLETSEQKPEKLIMDCSQVGPNGPPFETNCPEPKWVDEMVRTDPSPGKTIVNIGCNKGNDIVRWMELWDMSATRFWSQATWDDQLQQHEQFYFACEPDSDYVTASMVKPLSKAANGAVPTGVCVEPMPNNVNLLTNVSKLLGYQASTPYGSFRVVQAAAVANASPGEYLLFPDEPAGYEKASLSNADPGVPRKKVPVKTVDTIVDELGLHDVDILLIDTEGYDAEVLKGAKRTLAKVRYLEFEVHRDLAPWSSTSLRSVVSGLDEQGFDCYWAGNHGKLTAINECWSDDFEKGMWANAVCAKKGDAWSNVLRLFASRHRDRR
jgi:FkbM family methyltransferase